MSQEEKGASTKWPQMPWDEVVDCAEKVVFQVLAGDSAGTCFACSIGKEPESPSKYFLFATAWHVVKDVAGSDHPIYMIAASGRTICEAQAGCYGIFRLGADVFDTALILVKSSEEIISQKALLPMLGYDWQMARGTEIGWVGFPGIIGNEFCFFKGAVSGYLNSPPTYLVDGVAINGVSGGPAFDNRAHIIGLVSSYIPNLVDEYTTLPGLVGVTPIAAIRYWLEHKLRAEVL